MNKILCLIILFFICKISYAQNVFRETILSANSGLVPAVANILSLPDSNFIVFCSLQDSLVPDTSKFYVLKISNTGNIIWQKIVNTDSTIYLQYINYADNGYVITGSTWDPLNHQAILIIKVNFNGDTLWTRAYPEAGAGSFIKQMPNGDFLIIGNNGITPPLNQRHMIMRTDSSGNIIYYNKYSTLWSGSVPGIATSDGGSLLYDAGLTLIKVDTTGNITWTTPQFNSIFACRVAETNDSSYMVLANVSGGQFPELIFIKISNSGDTLWTKAIGNLLPINAASIEALNDGGFIICGNSSSDGLHAKSLLIRTDSLANVLWSKTYIANENSLEWGNALAIASDNGFIMNCTSLDTIQNKYSVVIIKTDSTGNSGCLDNDANLVSVPVNNFTDTIFNIPQIPLTASMSNLTVHYQNSNLFAVDSCPLPVSIYEMAANNFNSVLAFPNPFSDKLNITTSDNEIAEIILYDITSRRLLKQKFMNSVSLNTEHLSNGLYLYEVRNRNGLCKKGKVVKD